MSSIGTREAIMRLYEVRVADVSSRYVEASTRAEAVELVRDSLLRAMRLRATRPDPLIEKLWQKSSKRQRSRLLLRLDGMAKYVRPSGITASRERLERQLRHEEATQDWINRQVQEAPPLSPEAVASLAGLLDAGHRRWLFDQLN
jgi:hypothetical protein